MTAVFIVRAEVDPDARDAFDTWYETEHLPDAVAALGAAGASRGWSGVEENVLLRVRGHGGSATDDGVRRAQGHDRRVQPLLGWQGHPDPRRGRADPEDLSGGRAGAAGTPRRRRLCAIPLRLGFLCELGADRIPLPLGEGLGEGSPAAVPMSESGTETKAADPSPKGRGDMLYYLPNPARGLLREKKRLFLFFSLTSPRPYPKFLLSTPPVRLRFRWRTRPG